MTGGSCSLSVQVEIEVIAHFEHPLVMGCTGSFPRGNSRIGASDKAVFPVYCGQEVQRDQRPPGGAWVVAGFRGSRSVLYCGDQPGAMRMATLRKRDVLAVFALGCGKSIRAVTFHKP